MYTMKKKILSFITDGKKFLALRNNPEDPDRHGGDFCFVVTGGVDDGEDYDAAVSREVKEETGLDVKEVFDLNWGSVYKDWEGVCRELNFVSFADSHQAVILDAVEVVEYKWLSLDDFVSLIRWDDDKSLLKEVLKRALRKGRYFQKLEVKKYY